MKLTQHSKIRIRERTDLNHNERKMLFKYALKNGKSLDKIESEKIKRFIASKSKKSKVKLYRGYIFIYTKYNKRLITMYELPESLKEEKV